jgi:SAM-dependent methyltransferase
MPTNKDYFDNFYKYGADQDDHEQHAPWDGITIPEDVKSVLDVGCGRGNFLRSLSDKYERFGTDLSFEALGYVAGAKVLSSIDALPFASKSFDLVTSFEVLEHIPFSSYLAAIDELQRVSKQFIAVSVPNRQALAQSLVECSQCSCRYNPDWHMRSFTKSDLESLFPSFRMVEIRECGPITEDYPKIFDGLFLFFNRKPKNNITCPQCGYCASAYTFPGNGNQHKGNGMIKVAPERKKSVSSLKGLLKRPGAWLRTEQRPYWLFALYERKEKDERH